MKNFLYTGSQPYHATLRVQNDGKPATQDLKISKGDIVALDESHTSLMPLIRKGLLVESTKDATVKISDAVNVQPKKIVVADKAKDLAPAIAVPVAIDLKNNPSQAKTQA